MPKHGVPIRVLRVLHSSERFEPLTLSERQANRRRRIPDNLRPDFAAFSCNTQSIAAKKRHHQNTNDLGIRSCRLAVVRLKREAFFERSGKSCEASRVLPIDGIMACFRAFDLL